MKQFLIIVLAVFASNIFSQNHNTANNLSEKKLYDFMQMAIKQRNLNKTYGISIIPDTNYMNHKLDIAFLSKYLVDSVTIKNRLRFDSIEAQLPLDSAPHLNPYYFDDRTKCLSQIDIQSFLKNKKIYPAFEWRNSELGFDLQNKKEWYSFSLPIFNADYSLALMSIRYTCNLNMCGNGRIVLFKKENNKWTNLTLSHWDN